MSKVFTIQQIGLRLHHIGYAVRSTDDAIRAFEPIFQNVDVYRMEEPTQNVFFTFLSNDFEPYRIELVEPASLPNPVDNFLKNRECALYHVCFRVDSFQQGVQFFKNNGYFQVSKPFESAEEKDHWVCHFLNANGNLFEIIGKMVE